MHEILQHILRNIKCYDAITCMKYSSIIILRNIKCYDAITCINTPAYIKEYKVLRCNHMHEILQHILRNIKCYDAIKAIYCCLDYSHC